MNNRGQSLVMFVVLIPIIILILIMVVDLSRIGIVINEINHINEIAIDYGLDNYDDDLIRGIIIKNKKDIKDIEITRDIDRLYIDIGYNIEMIFINKDIEIESRYMGYIDNNKKIIERNK